MRSAMHLSFAWISALLAIRALSSRAIEDLGGAEGSKEQQIIGPRSETTSINDYGIAMILPGNSTTTTCLEVPKTTLSSFMGSSSTPCLPSLASDTALSSLEFSTTKYESPSCTSPASAPPDQATPATAPLSVPPPQPEGNRFERRPASTIIATASEPVGCATNCSQAAPVAPSSSHDHTKPAACERCNGTHKPENSNTTTSCVTSSNHNQTSTIRTVPYTTAIVEKSSPNAANAMTHAGKSVLGLGLVIYALLLP